MRFAVCARRVAAGTRMEQEQEQEGVGVRMGREIVGMIGMCFGYSTVAR